MRCQKTLRAFRTFLKGAGLTVGTGLLFSPILAQSDWSLVCYSDPVDQLVRQRSGYTSPPSLDYVASPVAPPLSVSAVSAVVQPARPVGPVSSLFRAPALPRYASAEHSLLQKKLLLEAETLLTQFRDSADSAVLEQRLASDGWRLAASAFFPETAASIYVKPLEKTGGRELNRYVIVGRAEISGAQYFQAVTDLESRTGWDKNAKAISVRPADEEGQEISVHWTSRMPWPLADRKYDFRSRLDTDGRCHSVVSVGNPAQSEIAAVSGAEVGVSDYVSVSLVLPEEQEISDPASPSQACRFATYYFDDPNLAGSKKFPTWLETHVAKSLLPSFSLDVVQRAREISDSHAHSRLHALRELSLKNAGKAQAQGQGQGQGVSEISAWETQDMHKHSSTVGCG